MSNQHLLSRTFERFREEAEWPTLETLQLDFARAEQDIDVRALAFEIPSPLGFVDQQRLVLRVRALRYLQAAAPLLTVWFSALQTANRRWLSESEESRLTREDVLRAAHGDEDLALQASQVLHRERWAFGGGQGRAEDADWSAEVNSEVRIVRDARSPEELLNARDEREHPPAAAAPEVPASTSPEPPADTESRLRRLGSWAMEHYLGAAAAGLTVLIIGTLFGLGYAKLAGDSEDPPPVGVSGESTATPPQAPNQPPEGPGILEQAAENGARTYLNPFTLSQTGRDLEPMEYVRVGCRVHAPTMPSVKPEGNWYRILSPPWNGEYYAPANSFWNDDVPGQTPYTHYTDLDVPPCD